MSMIAIAGCASKAAWSPCRHSNICPLLKLAVFNPPFAETENVIGTSEYLQSTARSITDLDFSDIVIAKIQRISVIFSYCRRNQKQQANRLSAESAIKIGH